MRLCCKLSNNEKRLMNSAKIFRLKRTSIAITIILSAQLSAAEETTLLAPVVVEGEFVEEAPFSTSTIDQETVKLKYPATGDTATLLSDVPGVNINQAGGVSGFPSIRGLADDRLRIKVDGMDLTSSCPNHMNPPLSYVTPGNVEKIDVYAGVSPVSAGGDSIGGSIIVESTQPQFAGPEEEKITSRQVGSYYQSNNDARGVDLNGEYATQKLNINYNGSWNKANNYDAGGDFKNYTVTGIPGHTLDRDEVGSTAYETYDHNVGFAYKSGSNLFDTKLGYQKVKEQLYPNQRMDMTDNEQQRANLGWTKQFQWGELETRAYYEDVDHEMNFGPDKRFYYTIGGDGSDCSALGSACANGMPMYSESDTYGMTVKANYELSQQDLMRVGVEYVRYRLDDYWKASGGMMQPNTFENINNGKRDRYALFSEWESQATSQWTTLLGIRYERVASDAGDVQGYNDLETMMMTSPTRVDVATFNSQDHKLEDDNIDLSALATYEHDETVDMTLGLARKVRSPNLYERYTWSSWQMAAIMNNFVGDGNGYVGNLDLDPETAYTASVTIDWHAPDRDWYVQATPFYTHVDDYIDAIKLPGWQPDQFNVLQYDNQEARIYGIDLSGGLNLGENALGDWDVQALVNYSNGENRDTNDNLYNIMPLNGKLTLNQSYRRWYNSLELVLVDSKDNVNEVRNEVETASYALWNLRASHIWDQVQLDVGVENLLDRDYDLPTGGAYLGQGVTMQMNPMMGMPPQWGTAVPGMGRSLYARVTVSF
jgi:iron complex outermembrane receptor protein